MAEMPDRSSAVESLRVADLRSPMVVLRLNANSYGGSPPSNSFGDSIANVDELVGGLPGQGLGGEFHPIRENVERRANPFVCPIGQNQVNGLHRIDIHFELDPATVEWRFAIRPPAGEVVIQFCARLAELQAVHRIGWPERGGDIDESEGDNRHHPVFLDCLHRGMIATSVSQSEPPRPNHPICVPPLEFE